MLKKIMIEITEKPSMRYTMNNLAICHIYSCKRYYIAFATIAEEIANIKPPALLEIRGYYKTYKWTDSEGKEQTREDFIIKNWRE